MFLARLHLLSVRDIQLAGELQGTVRRGTAMRQSLRVGADSVSKGVALYSSEVGPRLSRTCCLHAAFIISSSVALITSGRSL